MAKTVQETAVDFSAADNTPEIRFWLVRQSAEASTVADRLYSDIRLRATRDVDDQVMPYRETVHVGDSAVSTFSAGDAAALRALLQKLLNHAKAAQGL